MTIWYEIFGTLSVKDTPEARKLIDEYNDVHGDMQANPFEVAGGVMLVDFSGGAYMSDVAMAEADEAVRKFGTHVTEPAFLSFNYDNSPGQLYIGPPEREGATSSAAILEDIMGKLDKLTQADLGKLIAYLTVAACD